MADEEPKDDAPPPGPAQKVRQFPTTPGVYLMKDAEGKVIYVGKATNLRSRAGSYFTSIAAVERRTAELVKEAHAFLREVDAEAYEEPTEVYRNYRNL